SAMGRKTDVSGQAPGALALSASCVPARAGPSRCPRLIPEPVLPRLSSGHPAHATGTRFALTAKAAPRIACAAHAAQIAYIHLQDLVSCPLTFLKEKIPAHPRVARQVTGESLVGVCATASAHNC